MGHLHNGILLGNKKRRKFYPLWQNGWPGEHYAKWNKPVREFNTILFHSYVESNEQPELTSKIETNL